MQNRVLACRLEQRLLHVCATVVAAALVLLLWAAPASAAGTFPVVNTNDSGPGSLRHAITDADSSGGGGINSIPISATGTIYLQSPLPTISGTMHIDGPGAAAPDVNGQNAVVTGTGGFTSAMVFAIGDNTTAEISGLTASNARAHSGSGVIVGSGTLPASGSNLTLNNVTVSDNGSSVGVAPVGGIYISAGSSVSVNGSTVSGNGGSGGGGISNGGALTISNSVLADNGNGFGDVSNGGTATITRSTLSGNNSDAGGMEAMGWGGGIQNSGTMTLTDSTVNGNSAAWLGGGIVNWNHGVMAIDSSTVSNNTSGGGGGGISSVGALTISNSTIAGNSSQGCGGGVDAGSGTTTVASSTVAYNRAGCYGGGLNEAFNDNSSLVVRNSVIAANSTANPTAGNVDCSNLQYNGPPLGSEGYNLVGNTRGCSGFTGAGDLVNVSNPGIGALANNGGPTQTIALLPGSPAIDAGNPATPGAGGFACPALDQRGVARGGAAGRCDIGAVEVGTSPGSPSPGTILPPGQIPQGTVRVKVTGVSQSHRRWRRGNKLPNVATIARVRKPPVGTTFRFKLSGAARVRFAFTQTRPGRRVRGRCVAQTAKNQRKRACRRTVTAGSFSFTAGFGAYSVRFQGRISRTRRLKPGHYTLVITATNTAGSTTARLTFTIVS